MVEMTLIVTPIVFIMLQVKFDLTYVDSNVS